jgi:hypothetical protein
VSRLHSLCPMSSLVCVLSEKPLSAVCTQFHFQHTAITGAEDSDKTLCLHNHLFDPHSRHKQSGDRPDPSGPPLPHTCSPVQCTLHYRIQLLHLGLRVPELGVACRRIWIGSRVAQGMRTTADPTALFNRTLVFLVSNTDYDNTISVVMNSLGLLLKRTACRLSTCSCTQDCCTGCCRPYCRACRSSPTLPLRSIVLRHH